MLLFQSMQKPAYMYVKYLLLYTYQNRQIQQVSHYTYFGHNKSRHIFENKVH